MSQNNQPQIPKISIVTPSYNQGEYIEEAIRSVLLQRYASFEHIIIDNCSTDETKAIVEKYPHVIFISEPDEGQSDALNKGFEIAKGDIIGWLNADDYYLEGAFESVAKNLTVAGVDAVYGDINYIDEKGKFLRKLSSHRPLKYLILFYSFIQSTTFFFKREILQDKEIRIDKDMNLNMDKEFFAHLIFKNYKLKYIPEVYAAFRWHDNNKSKPSKTTQLNTRREDLVIFNRYMGTKIAPTHTSLTFMKIGTFGSKFIRQFLKFNH